MAPITGLQKVPAKCQMNKKHSSSSLKVFTLPIPKKTGHETGCILFQDGYTPLHLSSKYGHADVCKQLISAKASINVTQKVSLLMVVVIHQCYFVAYVWALAIEEPEKRITFSSNEAYSPQTELAEQIPSQNSQLIRR